MTTSFLSPTIANLGQLNGTQSNARVQALPDGGYVVAWTNTGASNAQAAWMQRFDGNGQPVGTPQQVFTTTAINVQNDITVSSDGRLWISGQDSNGNVLLRSFDPLTLQPQTADVTMDFLDVGDFLHGVQISPDANGPAGAIAVLVSVGDIIGSTGDIMTGTVTQAGVATVGGVMTTSTPALTLAEFIDGGVLIGSAGANSHVALVDNGNGVFFPAGAKPTDVLKLRDDLYIVTVQSTTTNLATVQAIEVSQTGVITLGNSAIVGSISQLSAQTTAGTNVYDGELIRLDETRVMVVWVSDGGDTLPSNPSQPFADGIYASVFNAETGNITTALLLRNLGTTFNESTLQQTRVSATLLADGRVAVTFEATGGLFSGTDVYHTIIEERVAGISVAGTSALDVFHGTAFGDTFSAVSSGDMISGGAGNDTVILGGTAGRTVDLAEPLAFPINTFVLSSVENLTGGVGTDVFYGTSGGNVLDGGAGNDSLFGRGGSDHLKGGSGFDMLLGSVGADTLDGGGNDDSLFGGADNDLVLGGSGNDQVSGGGGDDTVFGNENDDRVYGGVGNDQLDGGADQDYLDGGSGDDLLIGGTGNDTLRGTVGDDTLLGGDGNDTILAAADVAAVDGGNGIDTLVVSEPAISPLNLGLYVDLSAGSVVFADVTTMPEFTALISGIENVVGSGGADFIVGTTGANQLQGKTGNDTLFGGGGTDTLIGGAGADMFVFLTPSSGADKIVAFEAGSDKLALAADAFGDLASAALAGRLSINATGAVLANSSAQLTLDNSGSGIGNLSFDADGNGAGAAVLIATLTFSPSTGIASFSAADFVFL